MEDDIPEGQGPDEHAAHAHSQGISRDLAARLVSALVFGALTIGLAWAGKIPFALLVLVAVLLMTWEWGRIVRGEELSVTLIVHGIAVATAAVLAALGFAALGLAVLVIGAIIVMSLEFGEHPIFSAAGVLYTGLPAVALLWLRGSEPMGFLAVLFIFLVVWTTDTTAFLVGRAVGGPKLAPRVSPNKTWSGLAGGVLASGVTGALFGYFTGLAPGALALTGLLLGLVAQTGDLAESSVKRAFGVKDASNLIPGHGGFMDRLDGVIAVSVAAALIGLFFDAPAPSRALFTWLS